MQLQHRSGCCRWLSLAPTLPASGLMACRSLESAKMKRLALLVTIPVLLALDGPVSTLSLPCNQEIRFASRALAVRASPAMSADSIGFFARGAEVPVMSCANSWCQMETELLEGFVPEGLLLASAPAVPSASAPAPPAARRCCRVCRTGKACGNSCIARNKTCRVGRGCACNG